MPLSSSSEEDISEKVALWSAMGAKVGLASLAVATLIGSSCAVFTTVPAGTSKCFFERLDVDDRFVGQFEESSGQGTIDVTVRGRAPSFTRGSRPP